MTLLKQKFNKNILMDLTYFRKLLSVYVFSCFPFGFERRMWDLIVSVPDHCLSFYFDGIGSVFPIKILRAFIKRTVFRSNDPLHRKTCL